MYGWNESSRNVVSRDDFAEAARQMITRGRPAYAGLPLFYFPCGKLPSTGMPRPGVKHATVAMIDQQSLILLLRRTLPDVEIVRLDDLQGGDHLSLHVRSSAFAGRSLLDQHRLVYAAVDDALRDGRIHALQIKTEILET